MELKTRRNDAAIAPKNAPGFENPREKETSPPQKGDGVSESDINHHKNKQKELMMVRTAKVHLPRDFRLPSYGDPPAENTQKDAKEALSTTKPHSRKSRKRSHL